MQGTESSNGSPAEISPQAGIVSPFADSAATPQDFGRKGFPTKWIVIFTAIVLMVGGGVFVGFRFAANPYRTLEPFPLETYIGNYHALEGSRFKATLRVENDLGYSPGAGRLMVFSIEGDGRTVAALVPARLVDNVFSRGQRYSAELQIGDGGLIQLNSYVKD